MSELIKDLINEIKHRKLKWELRNVKPYDWRRDVIK